MALLRKSKEASNVPTKDEEDKERKRDLKQSQKSTSYKEEPRQSKKEDDEDYVEPEKDNGNLIFDLSGPKKLIIKKYKGISLVDIRETYMKDG